MRLILTLILPGLLSAAISRSPSSDGGATCSARPCTYAVTCAASPCAVTDIQTAIDDSWLGDTITLEAGKAWAITTTSITLKRRTNGSGVLTIRTSASDAQLPASDTRITPAYKPLLAEIRLSSNARDAVEVEQTSNSVQWYTFIGIWFSEAEGIDSDSYGLVTLWVPAPATGPLITAASNTSPIVITVASTSGFASGDHVVVNSVNGNTAANGWWPIANVTATTMDLVGSTGNGAWATSSESSRVNKMIQYDPDQMADHITFDRCLLMPAALSGMKAGVRTSGKNITIKNSYCDEVKAQVDSQCISAPSLVGPVTITNNFLGGGSGEIVMFGGVVPNTPGPYGTGQDPTDVTITHNAFYKDPALYKYEEWPANTYVRKGKYIKDAGGTTQWIATATGVTGSVMPTLPASACVDPFAPSGGCEVTDGTVKWQKRWFTKNTKWTEKNLFEIKRGINFAVKWNTFDHGGGWVDAQTTGPLLINCTKQAYTTGTARCQQIEYGHNVIRNSYKAFTFTSRASPYGDELLDTINFHDNLIYGMSGATGSTPNISLATRTSTPPYLSGLVFAHNTVERNPSVSLFASFSTTFGFDAPSFTNNLFDISGSSTPWVYNSSFQRKAAMDQMTVGGTYTFSKNVVSGETLANWPSGNYNTAWASIGFTDRTRANYRLRNSSTHQRGGTDGRDLGADTTQLPQIRNLLVQATDRAALLQWQVNTPQSTIPCVIQVSTDRDFTSTIADLDPTAYTRPETTDGDWLINRGLTRTLVLGRNAALSPSTTYWYRLHCGGALEQGSFTTSATLSGTATVYVDSHGSVQYGTAYSRATDTISSGGTATCVGATCRASFSATRGGIVYYRDGSRPVAALAVF